MTTHQSRLTALSAWHALTAHFEQVRDLHLRSLFVSDSSRGERLVAEGGVRLVRDGQGRRLEKASVELEAGDALLFSQRHRLVAVRVLALAHRRGPPSEARLLYSELDADTVA